MWRLTVETPSSADALPLPLGAEVRDAYSFRPESPWQALYRAEMRL